MDRPSPVAGLAALLVAGGLSVTPPALASPEPTLAPSTSLTSAPRAADTAGTAEAAGVTLALPATSRADVARVARTTVVDADGLPVAGRDVVVQVQTGDGSWTDVATTTSAADGTGAADVVVPRAPASQRWRAVVVPAAAGEDPGVTSAEQTLTLIPRSVRVVREGAVEVLDGRRLTQTWTVTTPGGTAVPDAVVVVRSRSHGTVERRRLTTDESGVVTVRSRPRYDSRWWARVPAGTWHQAGAAAVARVDNLPPGPAVRLPADAPDPRVSLPPQERALLRGPRPEVTTIPRRVWREMRGVTWQRGCPVGRADLRLVRVSYWAYDGYARRGEIVVNAAAASNVAATFADVFRSRLPMRSMYRVDRFGYSRILDGGDDYASMAAGNTSGFNCRKVVGYSAMSPHSYGFAIDINPWENPYRSRTGVVPNTYWLNRSHPLVAWRSSSHRMVQLLYRHGWTWPYGLGDLHHFSAPARGRHAASARSAEAAEHRLEHAAAGHVAGHRRTTGYVPGTDVALD